MMLIMFGKQGTVLAANSPFKVNLGVNDEIYQSVKGPLLLINHNTYMPLKDFVKATNLSINKNNGIAELNLTDGKSFLTVNVKENTYSMSKNETGKLVNKQGLLYVPIRSFAEFFGYQVFYLTDQKVVRIVNGNHQLSNPEFIHINKKIIQSELNQKKKKRVYLTFDDGPRDISSKIVNLLNQKQAKATFFMVEPNIKKYPEIVRRIIQDGHYIGLHSVTHNKEKLFRRPENVVAEMEQTRKTLYSIAQFDSRLVRVPYGSKPYMTMPFRNELAKNNFKMWDWNIDTLDWKYHRKNPAEIVQAVKKGIEKNSNRNEFVILLHDLEGTAKVLPEIIDYFRKQGFELSAYNPDEHFLVNFWGDQRL
jgi:peptidoglycan-N-acetylglucosamine deacetylase